MVLANPLPQDMIDSQTLGDKGTKKSGRRGDGIAINVRESGWIGLMPKQLEKRMRGRETSLRANEGLDNEENKRTTRPNKSNDKELSDARPIFF